MPNKDSTGAQLKLIMKLKEVETGSNMVEVRAKNLGKAISGVQKLEGKKMQLESKCKFNDEGSPEKLKCDNKVAELNDKIRQKLEVGKSFATSLKKDNERENQSIDEALALYEEV